MYDTDLQMFDVIGYISQNRDAHDEQVKLNILNLPL